MRKELRIRLLTCMYSLDKARILLLTCMYSLSLYLLMRFGSIPSKAAEPLFGVVLASARVSGDSCKETIKYSVNVV